MTHLGKVLTLGHSSGSIGFPEPLRLHTQHSAVSRDVGTWSAGGENVTHADLGCSL